MAGMCPFQGRPCDPDCELFVRQGQIEVDQCAIRLIPVEIDKLITVIKSATKIRLKT